MKKPSGTIGSTGTIGTPDPWAGIAAAHIHEPIPENALSPAQYAEKFTLPVARAREFLAAQHKVGRLKRAPTTIGGNRVWMYWPAPQSDQ